jgi:hypothetical protein
MEIRLLGGVDVSREGRRLVGKNHLASIQAEWVSGKPFATLNLGEGEIPLGIVEPRGIKFMEYLAKN